MKQCPPRVRASSSKSAPAAKLRLLKKCLHELQALYAEAISILNELLIRPSTEVVRDLCARFYVLQEYFVMRYHEARAYVIAALGHVEAALSLP